VYFTRKSDRKWIKEACKTSTTFRNQSTKMLLITQIHIFPQQVKGITASWNVMEEDDGVLVENITTGKFH
jgi:hypothetical protein